MAEGGGRAEGIATCEPGTITPVRSPVCFVSVNVGALMEEPFHGFCVAGLDSADKTDASFVANVIVVQLADQKLVQASAGSNEGCEIAFSVEKHGDVKNDFVGKDEKRHLL